MGQLRSAFLARAVSVADAGIDIKSAFITGCSLANVPGVCEFSVVGEYQFKSGEELTDHTFDAQVDSPTSGPSSNSRTIPNYVLRDSLIPDSGSDSDNFTAAIFAVRVRVEAQQFGRHYVALTLDGESLTVLYYDVRQMPSGAIPDDLSSLPQ
jgi:hypothetical protein